MPTGNNVFVLNAKLFQPKHVCSKSNLKEKKFILFRMWGGMNSCINVTYIYCSHYSDVISSNMLTGNDIFEYKYPVNCKQNFPFSHYFYKI